MAEKEKVYSEWEAAKFLGVAPSTVRRRFLEGVLPGVQKGSGTRIYYESDLIAFRDKGEVLKRSKVKTSPQKELMIPAAQYETLKADWEKEHEELVAARAELEKARALIQSMSNLLLEYNTPEEFTPPGF